jgi:predicted transcriptional regulator
MLSLDELRQITDVDQVYAQLSLLQAHASKEPTATASPTSSIQALSLLIPSLETLTDQTRKLASLLSHTANMADSISGKVRLLDRQQTNVQATIKHIDGINNVKHSARGVVQALEDGDCELAAEYIQKVGACKLTIYIYI